MKTFTFYFAFCVLVSGLTACATDIPASTALLDGPATVAPAGWVNYCARHLEDAGCPR